MDWPKITANIRIEKIQRIHKDIWEYVVKNGHKPHTPYFSDCVACTYASLRKLKANNKIRCSLGTISPDCSFCPIDWGNNMVCTEKESMYQTWLNLSKESKAKMDLAAKIRDIPFKTKEKLK